MKLKLFRVNTRAVMGWYETVYTYCVGTDKETVSSRVGVPLDDVCELDNDVIINITVSDVNASYRGNLK